MTPEVELRRLGLALVFGGLLGVWYGFLTPLRRRLPNGADGLFAVGLVWVWVSHSFSVCGGDIRMGNLLGMGLGCWGFCRGFGPGLLPIFDAIWKILGDVWA